MKAEEIFLAALERKTPAERLAYLDGACGNDSALRAQVEGLLFSHDEAGSFLNAPLFDSPPTTDQPGAEKPGLQIGPYKLLQQIGEGGFGVVYMAEQLEPVRRRVALKLIKPGMDTRQVIARFEAERQALAMMDHANIARVMDAGTTATGRPYFVMELVRGVPITAFCDQNNLPIRGRLALFASVCQAIQHAHQKGIIHRDIKPSNVLVTSQDGQPAVKIIDFGVAKAMGQQLTDKTLFTDFAQMIGTPLYMSPEQAELSSQDIDTRSDIYSLGVLLYELLTGSTPVDKEQMKRAAFDEIRRIIREDEPPKPSTRISSAEAAPSIAAQRHTEPAKLARLVRGELDWIVMKALEKDRNRRYETASAFAKDVEHFLNDEQVAACPPSSAYRLRKFARRNKAALATAAVVAAALLAGIAISTWQAIRATKAETLATNSLEGQKQATAKAREAEIEAVKQGEKAKTNAAEREAQRKVAEANFIKARQAVDDYFVKISDSQLLKAHGLQPLRRELLEAALKFYEELARQRSNDPDLQTELAGAHYRVGRIYAELGSKDEAQKAYAKAQELYERLLQQRPAEVELLHGRARCQYWRGFSAEAIASWERLIPQAPDRDDIRRELADAYNTFAISINRAGKEGEAIQWHNKAREIREKLVQADPENLAGRYALGQTLNNLGWLLKGRSADSLALYRRALEHGSFAFDRAPQNISFGRLVAIAQGNIADCEGDLGSQPQAIESYERAIGVWKRLALDNPLVPELQAHLASSYFAMAGYQRGLGRTEEWARLMRLRQQVLARQPTDSPGDRYNRACVYAVSSAQVLNNVSANVKELEDAKAEAKEAVDWLQQAIDAGFTDLALARTDEDLDSLRDREDFQRQLVRLEEKHLANQAAGVAKAENEKLAALAKSADGGTKAGLKDGQELLAIRQKRAEAKPESLDLQADVAATQHTIGLIHLNLSQFDEAAQSLAQAEAARRALVAADPQQRSYQADLAATILALGDLEWKRDRLAKGAAQWEQALALLDEVVRAEPGNNRFAAQAAAAQSAVGNCYGEIGLWREAALHHGKAFAAQPSGNSYSWVFVGYLSLYVGDRETYESVCRLALERSKSSIDRRLLSDLTACMNLSPEPLIEPARLVEMAQKVLAIEPDATWRRFRVCLAQYRAGQYAEALRTVEGPASGNTDVLPVKAMIYHRLGQPLPARQELDKLDRHLDKQYQAALASESGKLDKPYGGWFAWVMLELLRRESHQVVDGRPYEEGPLIHLQRARSYARLERMEQSDAEFAAALKSAGDNVQVLLAHVNVLDRLDRHDAAEAAFERMAALRPGDPTLWLDRSRYHVEQGNLAKADAALAKAAAISPDELHPFLEAGWWGSDETIGEGPLAPAGAGLSRKWHRVATGEFGRLDFQGVSELKALPTAYAVNYVYSPDTRSATLLLGSAARVRLEVNGELVFDGTGRAWEWGLLQVPVLLRTGRNTLAVTVTNPDHWQACLLRIADSALDRGYLLAQLGLWDEALAVWTTEFAAHPPDQSFACFHYAAMLLAQGRTEAYQHLCQQLQQQSMSGSWDAPRLPGASALAPVDEATVARLVEQIDHTKADLANNINRVMQCLVYYRAKRYQKVLDLLGKTDSQPNWIRGRANVLRALCQHALGNVSQARAELVKSDQWGTALYKVVRSDIPSPPGFRNYNGILESIDLVILSREAHRLIAGDASPHDRELTELTSDIRSYLGGSDKVTAAFDRAILLEPDQVRYWIGRCRALFAAERKEQAERDLEQRIKAARSKPDGWRIRGHLYAELGRQAEAASDFAKALTLMSGPDSWSGGPHRQLCAEIARWPEIFDRVVKLLPEDQILWIGRAYWHSQHGRWKEAAADLDKLNDTDLQWDETCILAGLKLLQGREQEYREITRDFIDRIGGDSNNQWVGFHLARTCTLSPRMPSEQSQVITWAETAMSGEKKRGLEQYVLGLAWYRAGEWERALRPLNDAQREWTYGKHPAEVQQVELVRAMCEFRLDQTDKARQRLTAACELIDQAVPYTAENPFAVYPTNWVSLNVLRREAEGLIGGAGKK